MIKKSVVKMRLNRKLLIISIIALISSGCSSSLKIIDSPVSFSEERVELTKEYISKHYDIKAESIEITPKIIVLHWTAINDYNKCWELFNRETIGITRTDLGDTAQVNVSIQFLISQDGEVHKLMPETWMARHCIGLNYNAIGIENVGGGNDIDNLTDNQVAANIKLVRYLKEKYPTIEYLIGHYEYRKFENNSLWLELDDSYRTKKTDPGERFMNAVREGVEDLNLKGAD